MFSGCILSFNGITVIKYTIKCKCSSQPTNVLSGENYGFKNSYLKHKIKYF